MLVLDEIFLRPSSKVMSWRFWLANTGYRGSFASCWSSLILKQTDLQDEHFGSASDPSSPSHEECAWKDKHSAFGLLGCFAQEVSTVLWTWGTVVDIYIVFLKRCWLHWCQVAHQPKNQSLLHSTSQKLCGHHCHRCWHFLADENSDCLWMFPASC